MDTSKRIAKPLILPTASAVSVVSSGLIKQKSSLITSAPHDRWWNFAAAPSGTHLDLYLYGMIGGWDWQEDVPADAEQVIALLQKYPSAQTITVHLNSVGGLVDEGLAILNTLRKHPAEISVEIDAFAMSIATMVMLAAAPGKLRMARNAHIMIHNVSNGAWGTAKDLEAAADVARRLESSLILEYSAKTGKTAEELQPLLDAETWFTAEEALAFGLVDEVTPDVDLDQAADAISTNIWKNMESGLKHMPTAVDAQMKRRLYPADLRNAQPTANGAGAGVAPPPASHSPTPPEVSAANHSATQPVNAAELQREFKQVEENRRTAVLAVFQPFGGLSGRYATEAQAALVDMNCSADKAREIILNKLGAESPGAVGGGIAVVTEDEQDKRISAAVQALHARSGLAKLERGNPYAHMTLMDMAKACLNQAGLAYMGEMPLVIAGRALNMQTRSDFPVILERAISEAVLLEYARVPSTWRSWCKVGQVSDFRDSERLRLGSIGVLDDVKENGELKNKTIPDGEKEKLRARTKGNIIGITREAIINDDLGYLLDTARWAGTSAANTLEALAYSILVANPKLNDGFPLFHAKHNNIAAGADVGTLGEATLDKMAVRMGTHKDIGGEQELMIEPAFLLVPRVDKMLATKWMTSPNQPIAGAASRAEPNGVMGLAEVVASSRVKSGYYLLANPNVAPVIEMLFLNGVEEPYVEVIDGWRTEGAEMKIRLDVGCGAIDYRGAQFNAGV